MKSTLSRIGLLSLICSASTLPVFAEVEGITSGKQLQSMAEEKVQTITTGELEELIANEPELVLIDIRTPTEITNMGGSIQAPQSQMIPRGWLEHRVTGVAHDKDVPIVVYCGAGIRSPLAAETLLTMGYTNVQDYRDGFIDWRQSGLPVTQ